MDILTLTPHDLNYTEGVSAINVGAVNYLDSNPPTSERLSLFLDTTKTENSEKDIFILDLDEAIGSVYLLFKYIVTLIGGGSPGAIIQDIVDEGGQLARAPLEWFRSQVTQTGTFETGFGFGISAIVLPFSLLAIKSGIEEMAEAWDKHWDFSEKRSGIQKNIQSIQSLGEPVKEEPVNLDSGSVLSSDDMATEPLAVYHDNKPSLDDLTQTRAHDPAQVRSQAIAVEKLCLATIDSALEHNFINAGIGSSVFGSGALICTKVVQDTTLQVVTLAVTKTAALTTATTIIGALGAIFFGPLTAAAAVALGSFFVHQAKKVGEELAEDRELIGKISQNRCDVTSTQEEKYQVFVKRKFTSREDFAARFKRWNGGFLGGASLFSIGAGIKAGLGVAGLVSSTLVASSLGGPIGIVMGLCIAGGITMAVCSWQFLVLSSKSKKHQAYRLAETPLLGRYFDAIQTVSALAKPNKDKPYTDSSLRASLYNFVSERDNVRQEFLQTCAGHLRKFRVWKQRAPDRAPRDFWEKTKQKFFDIAHAGYNWLNNLRAGFFSVKTYLITLMSNLLFTGNSPDYDAHNASLFAYSRYLVLLVLNMITNLVNNLCNANSRSKAHQDSIVEARNVYEEKTDDFTIFGLAKWLAAEGDYDVIPERKKTQRDLLTNILSKQKDFLNEKCQAYKEFHSSFFDTLSTSLNTQLESLKEILKSFNNYSLDNEQNKFIQAKEFLLKGDKTNLDRLSDEEQKQFMKENFLRLVDLREKIEKTKQEYENDFSRKEKIDNLLKNPPDDLNALKQEFLQLSVVEATETEPAQLNTRIINTVQTNLPDDLNVQKWESLRPNVVEATKISDEGRAKLNTRLAKYLIDDLTEELTATRGILFDMHRRSLHLQQELSKNS